MDCHFYHLVYHVNMVHLAIHRLAVGTNKQSTLNFPTGTLSINFLNSTFITVTDICET